MTQPISREQPGQAKAGRLTTVQMAAVALMTAVTCVLGPLAIPIVVSPVPLSLTNLVLFLSLYILKTKKALISYLIYLLLGIAGLPVFSGFSGGLGKLAGPTGGYLVGFIFMILVSGFFVERFANKRLICAGALVLGALVCNIFGTVWLCWQLKVDFGAGLAMGVIPYLPGDSAKIILAVITGPEISRRVHQAVGTI